MSGNSQQINRKSSSAAVAPSKYASISMTGQIKTNISEEELEDRIYDKIASKIQGEMDDMGTKIESQIKQIDDRVEKVELSNATNTNAASWFCTSIGSGGPSTSAPSDDDPSFFRLSEDLYSILATASWRSFPFWLSMLVIFGFQYLLAILLLDNQVDIKSDDNPLNLPANVEASVHICQGMLIVIALFSQRDLLDGIESLVRGFPDHFRGDSRFANMTRLQWRLSSIVRLIQGLLNFLASFVLALQAETVLDLVLNVMGVAFISDLDELAFRLSKKGYFGGSMKIMSKDVCEVRFHRTTNIGMSVPIAKRKIKKDAHIISAFAIFLTGLVVFISLAIQQDSGVYSGHHLRIEFGDEVLPFLGLFNGCYETSESTDRISRRLVYEQVGYPNGGKFGFCSDFGDGDGGWTFYIGEQKDVCKTTTYILRSGDTSTFSLLEAGETKWYTNDNLPMDYLEITENKAPNTECGQLMFNSTKDACPSIEAFDTMPMTKLSPSVKVENLDASVSHPIYWSNSTENGRSYTLIFFTGRRWIRTKSDHIQGLGNETSVLEIEDFFSENGLFKFINQLRTSVDEESEWVSAVSEIVDTVRDQGSPLGLLWYEPRYEANTQDNTNRLQRNLRRNFPSANLARPIDSILTCLFCDDETNLCLNEGKCNPNNGTCVCQNGETGELCQILPLGNGICNLRYNKDLEEYNYDGGDCCAGTCRGGDCGKDDLRDPFADVVPDVNLDGWYSPFRDKTEEWKESFGGREFAYGVEIVGDGESLEMNEITDPPRRFSHCIDPNTALLTIEQHVTSVPRAFYLGYSSDLLFHLASTTVRCDGTVYLQTPVFFITDKVAPKKRTFQEEVRVPFGARCEIGFFAVEGDFEFSIFADNQTVPLTQREHTSVGEGGRKVINFRIPESKCVWDAFVEHRIPPAFNNSEYEEFAGDVDLDALCDQDRDEMLDRYAVWKIAKSITDGDLSQNLVGHICDLTFSSSMELLCSNSRRVSDLILRVNGLHLPTEIGILESLVSQNLDNNNLTSLPSEIGRLTSLTYLSLKDNHLTSLPSEIGRLTSLTYLILDNNNLTSLPSEIGNLKSLARLDLLFNPMTSDSLPKEVQEIIIQICVNDQWSELFCPEFECIDREWSYGAYNCSSYELYYGFDDFENWQKVCSVDGFNSSFALVNPAENLKGKNACCKCAGGGNITFSFDKNLLPLGNGICNLHYNNEEHNYDGGDCCAGTCRGGDCGKDDLGDPFADVVPDVGNNDWYFPFSGMTEEWKETFGGREFAYGVEIVGVDGESPKMFNFTDPPRRSSHCIDPNTALLTIEQHVTPFQNYDDDGNWEWSFRLAGTTVRCDGTVYLQTPEFWITDNRPKNRTFQEEVRVPFGAQCEIGFFDIENHLGSEFSIFAGNQSVPLTQREHISDGEFGRKFISLRIPESKCVWDAFVEHRIPPAFNNSEYEEFAGDVDLDAVCNQDRDEVLDRYAVWKIAKSITDGDLSQNFVGQTCDLTWGGSMGIMSLSCRNRRRVSRLSLRGVHELHLPTEIGMFESLVSLYLWNNALTSLPSEIGRLTSLTDLTLDDNILTSLPSEIGRLTSLENLRLNNNKLTSLPPEIGRLTSLTYLWLNNNNLTSLPSEIGRLTSLEHLRLYNNNLTSLPSEIGRLKSLTYLPLENNNLTSLPSEIGRLTSLNYLRLYNNNLTSLPSEIGKLKSLARLDVKLNPMTSDSLPKEVKEIIIQICVNDEWSELFCPEFECIDREWSYGAYDCSSYELFDDDDHDWFTRRKVCAVDGFNSSFALVNPDENLKGKKACCKCGGGNITLFL